MLPRIDANGVGFGFAVPRGVLEGVGFGATDIEGAGEAAGVVVGIGSGIIGMIATLMSLGATIKSIASFGSGPGFVSGLYLSKSSLVAPDP